MFLYDNIETSIIKLIRKCSSTLHYATYMTKISMENDSPNFRHRYGDL